MHIFNLGLSFDIELQTDIIVIPQKAKYYPKKKPEKFPLLTHILYIVLASQTTGQKMHNKLP